MAKPATGPFPKVEVHLNDRLAPAAFDVTRTTSAPPDRITPYQLTVLRRLAVPGAYIGVTATYGVRVGMISEPEVFIDEPGSGRGIAKVRGDALASLGAAACVDLSGHGCGLWITKFEISDTGRLVLKRAERALARLLRKAKRGAAA